MRTSSSALLLAAVVSAMSCTAPTGSDEPARAQQAVVGENARADTTHDAVVAIETEHGSLCSGTVIQRAASGDRLYVLTAAHCCRANNPPSKVLVGGDYSEPVLSIGVDAFQSHPCYNPLSDDYDFCVLSVVDHGELNVRPIPLASGPDNLGPDSLVTVVGFGSTPASNTLRRRAVARLGEITPLTLAADQREGRGGICFGDSGGPFLIEQNGAEVVAGVVSFGAPTSLCNVIGVAGRVTFPGVREHFIDRVLAGEKTALRSQLVRRNGTTGGPVRDTYIASDQPGRNFGDAVDLLVGTPPDSDAIRQALVRFDLAGLPTGATLLTARVGLHEETRTGGGTITVHRATRDWDEHRETWSSFDEAYDPRPIASFGTATAVVSSTDEIWFDITDLARDWVSGKVENDGLLLRHTERAQTQLLSSEIGRVGERPWLQMCFLPATR
jgi:secreted trypsin-like serine protease